MREIKFRAWDTEDKKMRAVTRMTFGLPATGHTAFVVHLDDGVDPVTRHCEEEGGNKAIVMQYTGLKDKNGKEIYEGDILQAKNYVGKDMGIYEVVWDGRGWHYQRVKNEWVYFASEFVKIIGNIYESPELLK